MQQEMRQCPEERNSLRRLWLFSVYHNNRASEENPVELDYEVDSI